jgi:TDG/mug DNA glycosylase family protein
LPPLRDRIGHGLNILFVGINPGIRSALTGHHFAGYSNRFWRLLYGARLVPEPVTFEDDDRLPEWGYGITNLVPRATAGIGELSPTEYREGRQALLDKVGRYRPRVVALVGITLFRALFEHVGTVGPGPTNRTLAGSPVFLLPNPSGRNANFSYAEMLQAFKKLRRFLGAVARKKEPNLRLAGAAPAPAGRGATHKKGAPSSRS